MRTREPDEALGLWQALVEGRYSVIDWIDTDRRRYLVAVDNRSAVTDPRLLTKREREVVEFAVRGRTNADAAYALGLSIDAVASSLRDARRKLGGARRGDLAALFGATSVLEADLDGDAGVVAFTPSPRATNVWRSLTETERDVAARAIRGDSDDAIARSRGRSPRTIQNQLARIYRRLGVATRSDLAALLGDRPEDTASP